MWTVQLCQKIIFYVLFLYYGHIICRVFQKNLHYYWHPVDNEYHILCWLFLGKHFPNFETRPYFLTEPTHSQRPTSTSAAQAHASWRCSLGYILKLTLHHTRPGIGRGDCSPASPTCCCPVGHRPTYTVLAMNDRMTSEDSKYRKAFKSIFKIYAWSIISMVQPSLKKELKTRCCYYFGSCVQSLFSWSKVEFWW